MINIIWIYLFVEVVSPMEMKDLFLLCSTGRRSLPEIPAVLGYFREFHSAGRQSTRG
jgi:hypothetical protein